MARFFKLLILLPIAALILAFAIANRQIVTVSFDPFSAPDASTAIVTAPLFLLLFLSLIVGTFVGGVATWLTQGTNRRKARLAQDDAARWRAEATRLREQPTIVPAPQPGRALARPDY